MRCDRWPRFWLISGLGVFIVSISGAAVSAHIGSPNVFFDGNAGPYKVLVEIRPPDVVPGIAQVDVRVDRDDITSVGIQPLYYSTGANGAPRPDPAQKVRVTSACLPAISG
ncbi:MAG TPA: hypothetical protein VJX67_27285 [Blastocatellia bacterium]|nr:hypothetical protein [Blastocatellia bacterium]